MSEGNDYLYAIGDTLLQIKQLLEERLPSEEKTVYKTVDGREVAKMIETATKGFRELATAQKLRAEEAEHKIARLEDGIETSKRDLKHINKILEQTSLIATQRAIKLADVRAKLSQLLGQVGWTEHRDLIHELLSELEGQKVDSQQSQLPWGLDSVAEQNSDLIQNSAPNTV